MRVNFKNFGLLEFLVVISAVFVVGMLIWTTSTRPAVEAKANLVKENHNKVVSNINDNLEIKNPFSEDSKVKTDPDPRIKAEGKAGQTVEMGVIFLMSSNFLPEPESEWIVGTCFKSPCVAAGNNELTSIYR